jgi:hypothetical protein
MKKAMETKTVGRAEDNDIRIDKPDVSEHHAKITRVEDNYFLIEDLGSLNHTFVNGYPVKKANVSANDEVRLSKDTYINLAEEFGIIPPVPSPVPGDTEFTVDFLKLKEVWEGTERRKKQIIKKNQRKSALIRVGIMLAIIISCLPFRDLLAGGFMIISIIAGGVAGAVVPIGNQDEIRQLNEDFYLRYICPNKECRKSLGQFSWDFYAKTGKCPHCQTNFKKEK